MGVKGDGAVVLAQGRSQAEADRRKAKMNRPDQTWNNKHPSIQASNTLA